MDLVETNVSKERTDSISGINTETLCFCGTLVPAINKSMRRHNPECNQYLHRRQNFKSHIAASFQHRTLLFERYPTTIHLKMCFDSFTAESVLGMFCTEKRLLLQGAHSVFSTCLRLFNDTAPEQFYLTLYKITTAPLLLKWRK
jgi:hypothetical protein